MGRIIFVTGTDTGVGKTLLTALLLQHLRAEGKRALAIKPFCSGGREDAELLHSLQDNEISLDEVNPFHFKKPLAPYLAAKGRERVQMDLKAVVQRVQNISKRCDYLLVEGAGGLLVPIGKSWFVVDLIHALDCEVLLVSRNRLGTINHTLLSVQALEKQGEKRELKVVLMGQKTPDLSAETNGKYLQGVLAGIPVVSVRFLGAGASRLKAIIGNEKREKKVLARLVV